MLYAVIESGGKQLKVEVGKKIFTERINIDVGKDYIFNKVLCVVIDENNCIFGKPYVNNAKVVGTMEKHGLSKKIQIYKYKAKHNERKRIGHRQFYSQLRIKEIIIENDKNHL